MKPLKLFENISRTIATGKSVIIPMPHHLSYLTILLFLLCILSDSRRAYGQNIENSPRYIFPNKNSAAPAIYINPNPSTRSRTQHQQQRHRQQVSGWLTPTQIEQADSPREQLKQQRRNFGDEPKESQIITSSIGRSDQVAEWPFFKSLISSRNNQAKNVAQFGQSGPIAVAPPTSGRQVQTRSPQDPTETFTTTTSTTTTTTTTQAPPSTTQSSSTTTETTTGMQNEIPTDTTTLTYTEPTVTAQTIMTTPAPTTTTTAAAPNLELQNMNDPLFLPNFHSSLQQAVDRLVKMTANSNSARSTTEKPTQQSVNKQAGGLKSSLSLNVLLKNFGVHNLTNLDQILLKSSLAKKDPHSHDINKLGSQSGGQLASEQKLSISGMQNIVRKSGLPWTENTNLNGTMSMDDDDSSSSSSSSSSSKEMPAGQSAECKIEYTMKHANISLINESGSDYTCDYIIDRKLTLAGKGRRIDIERVCKLKLMSEFFSNETQSNCEGTHLSIGQNKYCYLMITGSSQSTLDRVFEFPINEDVFDVKLVHKQVDLSKQLEAAEIHLEIKPLADDEDCKLRHNSSNMRAKNSATSNNFVSPNVEYDVVETMPETPSSIRNMQLPTSTSTSSTSTTSTTTTTTTIEPPSMATMSNNPMEIDSRESKRLKSSTVEVVLPSRNNQRQNETNKNRKFILKVAHDNNNDNKLHPLNNRFKVSQAFDIGQARPVHYTNSSTEVSADKRNHRPTNKDHHQQQQQQHHQQQPIKLCDTFKHVSTVGQLMTPEYPNYYQANTNCSFVIKRASIAYCQLQLHFRDFDLINNKQAEASNQDCPEDYLQIGNTRYCNRYAMIGHKMRINFTEMDNYSIRLLFRSDHMQSGRGFLIKYQQLICESPEISVEKTRNNKQEVVASITFDEPEPNRASPKTVAPPIQQPDFSLAMKTTSPRQDPRDSSQSSRDKTVETTTEFNERIRGHSENSAATTSPSINSIQLQPVASTISSAISFSQANFDPTTSDPANEMKKSQYQQAERAQMQCNQFNNEMSFFLKSPTGNNYSISYENNLQCLYYVRRNSSQVCYLELTFIKFDLEPDQDCRYDFLEINNVRLCGLLRDRTTRIYFFNEPIKMIKFQTDHSGAKTGFLIKVDQLECASNGSIRRRSKQIEELPQTSPLAITQSNSAKSSAGSSGLSQSVSNHSQRMFEYDALTITKQTTAPQRPSPIRTLPDPSSYIVPSSLSSNLNNTPSSMVTTTTSCDELLYGPEVVIRSPFWPESYSRLGQELSACRYTILRNSAIGDKICQLELRFVNLRLGPADCIEIVGHELLCGFNARNMLRYYQFGESQTHMMIRFLPGGGGLRARTANSDLLATRDDDDDILPIRGRPLRFMLVAKQHECIDGFLAPISLDGGSQVNRTNLLYTNTRESSSRPAEQNQTTEIKRQPDRILATKKSDSILKYDFSNTLPTIKSTSTNDSKHWSNPSEPAQSKLINRMPLMANQRQPPQQQQQQATETGMMEERCLIQFSQYNGIVSSTASVLSRIRRSQRNECELRFKLLPGFCRIQLTFGEFELDQRIVGLCLGDYLEIDKYRYCSNELRNTSRSLIGSPNDNFVAMKFVSSSSSSSIHGFRAIFKQIECDQPVLTPSLDLTLKPLLNNQQQSQVDSIQPLSANKQTPSGLPQLQSATSQQAHQSSQQLNHTRALTANNAQMSSQVLFREIVIRSEFFELNVANLSRGDQTIGYEPNMFIVYRIKRVKPEVCKLRLMFYRFDLEPSLGCKRDFLDINNVDRLCGRLEKAEDTRRDYDWIQQRDSDRDFLISFVSDSSIQSDGILMFGQQLSDCKPPITVSTNRDDDSSSATSSKSSSPNEETSTNGKQQGNIFDDDPATQDKTNAVIGKEVTRPSSDTNSGSNSSENCNKILYEEQFSISSPNWPQQYGPKTSCYYLIHKARPDICSVTFNILSMILDLTNNDESQSSCDPTGSDHLDIDGRLHCGLIDSPRTETIDFGRRQFFTAKFNSIQAKGFGFFIEAKQNNCTRLEQKSPNENPSSMPSSTKSSSDKNQNQLEPSTNHQTTNTTTSINKSQNFELAAAAPRARCNELIVDETSLIESENFPANYRHNQDCLFVVRRRNQSICALDLTMDYFDLESSSGNDHQSGENQCDGGDYLEIDYSRFCGSYPTKHRLRFNYFADELDKLIRFHSDASLSRTGFSITVRQVSDCDQQNQNIQREQSMMPNGNNGEIISYLPDSSTTNSNKRQESAPSSSQNEQANIDEPTLAPAGNGTLILGNNFSPQTLCQFTYHKENQFLVSPNYNEDKLNYDNNVDCLYRIRAKSYEICSLKLTFVDLDLEQSNDCINDYLLLDNRRYCGHKDQTVGMKKVVELQFSDNLPREIHLLYHTNAHISEGRGFKLFYEQLACDNQDDQRFQLQNGDMRMDHLLTTSGSPSSASSGFDERQTRKLHFGLINYPKNYVSNSNNSTIPSRGNHITGDLRALQTFENKESNSEMKPDLVDGEEMTLSRGISVRKSS